jgi:hypothetical protein
LANQLPAVDGSRSTAATAMAASVTEIVHVLLFMKVSAKVVYSSDALRDRSAWLGVQLSKTLRDHIAE